MSMGVLEGSHGWQSKLGPPNHYNVSTMATDVPASDAAQIGPGWTELPEGASQSGQVPIVAMKSSLSGSLRVAAKPGKERENSTIMAFTKTPDFKSTEHATAVALMHDVEIHGLDKTVSQVSNMVSHSVKYGGDRGTDVVSTNESGTKYYRTESKTGENPQLGKSKSVGWVENDPRHCIISDVKHFAYGNGAGDGGVKLSMDDRIQAMRMSNMCTAEKNYYEAISAYAQAVESENFRNWVADEAKKQTTDAQKEKFKETYGISVKNHYTRAELINFKEPQCNLFFKFLDEYETSGPDGNKVNFKNMKQHVVHYWSNTNLLFGTEGKDRRPEGMTKLLKNTNEFFDSAHFPHITNQGKSEPKIQANKIIGLFKFKGGVK